MFKSRLATAPNTADSKLKYTSDMPVAIYHKEGDAGYDLYAAKDTWIFPFKTVKIPLGIKIAIPKGFYGFVTSRSGMSLKGIVVVNGIIDSTYRGEINAIAYRIGLLPRKVKKGTRLCQIIISPYTEPPLWEITSDEFSKDVTDRGNKGFGSSGIA